jgi:hypothetical protein
MLPQAILVAAATFTPWWLTTATSSCDGIADAFASVAPWTDLCGDAAAYVDDSETFLGYGHACVNDSFVVVGSPCGMWSIHPASTAARVDESLTPFRVLSYNAEMKQILAIVLPTNTLASLTYPSEEMNATTIATDTSTARITEHRHVQLPSGQHFVGAETATEVCVVTHTAGADVVSVYGAAGFWDPAASSDLAQPRIRVDLNSIGARCTTTRSGDLAIEYFDHGTGTTRVVHFMGVTELPSVLVVVGALTLLGLGVAYLRLSRDQ